jgi:hypothetical protein
MWGQQWGILDNGRKLDPAISFWVFVRDDTRGLLVQISLEFHVTYSIRQFY